MIGTLIYLLFIGIVAGYLARLLVPGRQDLGFWRTVLLGIVGSFVGGFIGYLIFSHDPSDGPFQAGGIFGSIIGAVIALLIYNKASTGHATRSPERR